VVNPESSTVATNFKPSTLQPVAQPVAQRAARHVAQHSPSARKER
jgi:hypothetical protein